MKLLFFASANSIHTKRWLEFFSRKAENEVHLATFIDPTMEIEGVTMHRIKLDDSPKFRLARLYNSRRILLDSIARIKRQFSPDLIHIHSFNPYAYFAAIHFRVPLVATPWGSDIVLSRKLSSRFISRRLAKKADSLVCDAAHMKERLIRLGTKPDKVHIVFFGTNVEEYHPRNRDSGLSAELGWDPRSLLVVSTRALNPLYNVETLVRAAPAIAREAPNARFLIVGGGEERSKLEALARELGVANLCSFSGRVSDLDMRRMVASADVYVSTALSDGGLAASTAEAMASGVPVVITEFGDNQEWLGQEQAGLSFPAKDHEALARQVLRLLGDPAARSAMGALGRETICQKNNYHLEMGKVEKIYQSLIG